MTIVIESGMAFKCSSQTCFQIEKSKTYAAIQNRVKCADFLFLRKKEDETAIWCVEAKSSSPRPETQPDFDKYILGIKDQLLNTFSLYVAMRLNRHSTANELPPEFETPDLSTVKFQFVLVISGQQMGGLQPIQDALRNALYPTIKTWHLKPNPVIVINGDKARKYGLIQ